MPCIRHNALSDRFCYDGSPVAMKCAALGGGGDTMDAFLFFLLLLLLRSDRVTGTCSWLFLYAYSSVRAKTREHYANYHHQDTLKVAMSHEIGSGC